MPEYNNEKEIQKVVQGQVSVRKKGFFTKVKEAFIAEDFKTAASSATERVIVPMIKRTFADAINNAVNILLFGSFAFMILYGLSISPTIIK